MKTPITIIRGPRQGQHGWIAGDPLNLNPHVTKVFVYPLDHYPRPPLDHPSGAPRSELVTNLRAMTDMERILFNIVTDNGAAFIEVV